MAGRRLDGEGSIVKKYKDGVQIGWKASIHIGYDENGKRIRKEFFSKTQKEVKAKLDNFRNQMLIGTISDNKNITLDEWYHTWLFDYRKKELKPNSFTRYEGIYRNYIKDTDLGKVKLTDLRTSHLQRYYNNLMDIYNKPASTIKTLNTRIKPCLEEAERQGYIQKNYCKLVKLPADIEVKEIKILTKEEQNKFLNYIDDSTHKILFMLALGTGLRLGELLGLKWSDINFDEGILTVNRTLQRITDINRDGTRDRMVVEQEPKTKNSIRDVNIPNNILKELKIHRKNILEQKLLLGKDYKDNDYVICNDFGEPMNNNRPAKLFHSILNKLDIPQMKFHALRHTYATRLFEAGVPPKTVQALMGHYDISITMDIYTHVMKDSKLEAVEKINDIFDVKNL